MWWLIGGAVFFLVVTGWIWYETKHAPVLESNDDQ